MQNESPADRVIEALGIEIFRHKLSQEKLSEITGMSTSAISRRLTNQTAPTIPELIKIADAVDADIQITLVPRATITAPTADSSPQTSPVGASPLSQGNAA